MSAIAILHPSGLLGKELRETLEARHPEWSDLRLLSSREEEIGTLTEIAGAAALVGRFEPESLAGVAVAFFCGEMADNRPLLAELPEETTAIVLSYDATVEDGLPIVAGVNTAEAHGGRVLLSPHPGAVLLAHLLHPLRRLALAEAVATLIQPASMRDDAGLEELFEQTRQIIAMTRRTPTPVFAAHPLLEQADKPRHLGPVDAAASDKVLLGAVRKDEATGGFWLWAAMDNLTRGGALNAIEIAEAVV